MNERARVSRPYGLWIVIAWSMVLVAEMAARLWLLVNIPGLMSLPTRNWITLFVTVELLFIVGFCVAAYGLARRLAWGRRLFIGLNSARFGLLIIGLFLPDVLFSLPDPQLPGQRWWLLARYLLSLILPVWYLSLTHVRALFGPADASSKMRIYPTHDE